MLRVQGWARDGLTDDQIAGNMGIGLSTYYRWQQEHQELRDAIKKGKAPVDISVENALLKRALGYDYEEVIRDAEPTGKTDENGKPIYKTHIKTVTKHVAPDVLAQFFWLKNRRPDKWREKQEMSVNTEPVQIIWGKE